MSDKSAVVADEEEHLHHLFMPPEEAIAQQLERLHRIQAELHETLSILNFDLAVPTWNRELTSWYEREAEAWVRRLVEHVENRVEMIDVKTVGLPLDGDAP